MTHIAIVGGGASGVLLAIHLMRADSRLFQVTIIEKRDALGAGIAYATNHPDHLLNVRAEGMSAFQDDPGHFVQWLGARSGSDRQYGPDDFVPRHLYRDYLNSLLSPLLAGGCLRHAEVEAVAARETAVGVEITCRDGTIVTGDIGVIATGNEGPSLPSEPWRFEGWSDHGLATIAADASIVVIGTGLTMVDRVLSLLHGGHRGPIIAISRRGLVPQVHRLQPTVAISAGEVPLGDDLSRVAGWMRRSARRAEHAGSGWRSGVDGLRPHTQRLWQSLSLSDRRRFLRHARVFWDVHRHRIAPVAARRLDDAQASGQLRIVAARIARFEPVPKGVAVHLTRRRTGEPETVQAAVVIECRGRVPDVAQSENPILLNLLASGTARPDELSLGLAVTNDCQLLAETDEHKKSDRFYALGPVTAGSFWEIVAIPDIRQQAKKVADHLLARETARS